MLRWLSAFALAATLATGGSAGGARGERCWPSCPVLVRVQADGSGRVDVKRPPGDSTFVGFSADLTRMLYMIEARSYYDSGWLYSQRLDGSDVRLLYKEPSYLGFSGSLSPDGRRLALRRDSLDCGGELWTASGADGSGLRQIDPCIVGPVQWSPDSARIAFVHSTYGFSYTMQLETVSPDGTGERPLTPIPKDYFWFDWSPRGDRIAYTVGPSKSVQELHVVRTDGSGDRALAPTSGPLWENGPTFLWSPDGRWLAFSYGRLQRLAVIGADGRGLRMVDVYGGARSPAWAPNGNLGFVTGERSIWVERADGSRRRLLVKRPVDTSVGRLWWARNGLLAYDTWRQQNTSFVPTLWIRRPNGTTRHYTDMRRRIGTLKNELVAGNVWWAPDSRSLIYSFAASRN